MRRTKKLTALWKAKARTKAKSSLGTPYWMKCARSVCQPCSMCRKKCSSWGRESVSWGPAGAVGVTKKFMIVPGLRIAEATGTEMRGAQQRSRSPGRLGRMNGL
jgi:hypothetical protein